MTEFSDLMSEGGWVMYPILGLSLAATTVIVERFWTFYRFFHPQAGAAPADPQRRFAALERGLGFVSTVITAEPMLGILGTVTGIIKTFGAFRPGDAAASPLAATAGIGEALITTAAGLVVALVLLFPYNALLGLLARAAARLDAEGKTSAHDE